MAKKPLIFFKIMVYFSIENWYTFRLTNTIDAEKDDAKEFLQQYILENKGNSGTVELFVKDSQGEYTKVEESIIGNRK